MGAARFAVTVTAVLLAGFFGTSWLLRAFTVRPLQPDPRLPSFHHVDTESPQYRLEQSSVGDGDAVRDRLRNEVLDYAKALADDPCNTILKASYIKAVVAYARAWISIAPCIGIRSCTSFDVAELDRARQAFGTPLDHRVRDAMQRAHARATFGTGDFPQETARLVADLAADDAIDSAPQTRAFRRVTAQFGNAVRADCGR
ncbi:MAG TPA: hypothetical protein VE993_03700 [Stellaceae bacterium]|nr:hypothetical protein [Stellaceae bacterium]